MANICPKQIKACAIRVARLEPNGVPDPGANNLYVSDALTTMTATPEIEAGTEIVAKNACGDICVNYKTRDRVKRYTIALTLCGIDPQLHELLAGGSVYTDGTGYEAPRLNTDISPNGTSIELWAYNVLADGSLHGTYPYIHWAWPRVHLAPGERTFEDGVHLSPFTGFATENENWWNGPRNDWREAPLLGPYGWQLVSTIPAASCGYQTLAAS